jgi:hypothetical protein
MLSRRLLTNFHARAKKSPPPITRTSLAEQMENIQLELYRIKWKTNGMLGLYGLMIGTSIYCALANTLEEKNLPTEDQSLDKS